MKRPRSRSRSKSRDGQVDRPVVSISVLEGTTGPGSLRSVEAGIAGSCQQHRRLPAETRLSHRAPGHGFLAAKTINLSRGWLFDDSAVEAQALERYHRPTSTV